MATGIGAGISPVFELKPGGGGAPPAYSNLYSMDFIAASSQYLEASATPLLGAGGTGNFSISFWFKADALSGANQRMISIGQSGTGSQFLLYINTSDKLALAGPYTDTNAALGVISAGTWYHVIYRVDKSISTNNVGWVVNGTIIDDKNEAAIATFVADGTTRIGRKTGTAQYFDGYMDEVSIFDKYLSNAECVELYNSGTPTDLAASSMAANLQHWWRMGDPNGISYYPTIPDAKGSITMTMTNMVAGNIQTDVP